MPPDMNKLPMPGDDLEVSSQSNDKEVKDLLKIKDDNNSEESSSCLLYTSPSPRDRG